MNVPYSLKSVYITDQKEKKIHLYWQLLLISTLLRWIQLHYYGQVASSA